MSWRFLFGGMLVILAIGFLLEYAGVISLWTFLIVLGWEWPTFVMLIGINQLLVNPAKPWGALTLIGVSIVLLVRSSLMMQTGSSDLGSVGHKLLIVPAVLAVLLGIRMMLPREEKRERYGDDSSSSNVGKGTAKPVRFEHDIHDRVVLTGMFFKNESQKFHGGKIIAIVGDYEMDLRGAMLDNAGADLKIIAVFGSVQILVPEHMLVSIEAKSMFASVQNNAKSIIMREAGRPELKIKVMATMGSVEITN
ncbi:MAG: LiaF domain-containing protein [bacterium]